jgi:hypothetical protein
MTVHVVPIDSKIWGQNVLTVSDVSVGDELEVEELKYVSEYSPAYVSIRLPMEDLDLIHKFEKAGFSFMECQLRLLMRIKTTYDVSRYGYIYQKVMAEDELEDVLEIARCAIVHDRFSIDKGVPKNFSGSRYEAYVRQSFQKEDEEVWRLFDPSNNITLGFRTHRCISKDEGLLLLGGINPNMLGLGLGVISSHFCFNQLLNDGIKRVYTHISMINKPVFDLEVTHFGFRYQSTFAVLRKLYT